MSDNFFDARRDHEAISDLHQTRPLFGHLLMHKPANASQVAQDFTDLSPQEFSRLLDCIHASEGAEAAQALLARYSEARAASSGGVSLIADPAADFEKMLAEIDDESPARSSSTPSIKSAAATNAESAATTPATPVPTPVAEPITELQEGEENIIEAIEAQDEAPYKVPPSLRAKLKKQGEEFRRKHKADIARINKPFREAELRIAKKKQADEYVARGLPADFDALPYPEQRRLSRNLSQRKWRAGRRESQRIQTPQAGASIPTFSYEWHVARQRELDAHLSGLAPARAGQLRRNRLQIIGDLIVVLQAGGKISDYKLGKLLGISEGAASTRNKRLKAIAAAIGGAWKQSG